MLEPIDGLPEGVIGFEAVGTVHAEDYADWVRHLGGLFGWMIPGKFEVFHLDERDAAVAWAAAD